MGLYNDRIMPRLVSCACASKAFRKQRAAVVPQARGRVLEVGSGSGLNFRHYDPSCVEELVAVEPDPRMMGWARQAGAEAPALRIDYRTGTLETTTIEDHSIDTAVFTFVLCTIPDWRRTLAELRRVMRPGGQVLFCEHGLAPDADVVRWQHRIDGLWQRLVGGCHLTRSAPAQLAEAGFRVTELDAAYLPKTPRVVGYLSRGVAVLP